MDFSGNILPFNLPADQPAPFYPFIVDGGPAAITFWARNIATGDVITDTVNYSVFLVAAPEPASIGLAASCLPLVGLVARRRT